MPAMGLFSVDNPLDRVNQLYGQAANSFASMTKNIKTTTEAPDKTVGGGLSSAAGMGLAGYMVGGGMTGGAIGAGIGALAYFLS